jgi:hypothetical protein
LYRPEAVYASNLVRSANTSLADWFQSKIAIPAGAVRRVGDLLVLRCRPADDGACHPPPGFCIDSVDPAVTAAA